MTVVDAIQAHLATLPEGQVISADDLLHLGSRDAVGRALSRLTAGGLDANLLRLRRGLYAATVPGRRFPRLFPELQKVRESLSAHMGVPIENNGGAEANGFHLSLQVPIRESFVTPGRAFKISWGKGEIPVYHAPAWQFCMSGAPGRALRALAWIGEQGVTKAATKIRQVLEPEHWAALVEGVAGHPEIPSWVREAIAGEEAQAQRACLLETARAIVEQSTAAGARGFDVEDWLGRWLDVPQPALGGRQPAELLGSRPGFEAVNRLLGSLASGSFQ